MSATTNDYGLTDKHSYDELTDKQQAVVDVWADAPDLSEAEVAERAGVSHAYPNMVRNSYGDIIESRREDGGGGNAADLDAGLGDDRPVQHFSERPYSEGDGEDDELVPGDASEWMQDHHDDGPIAVEDDGPEGEDILTDASTVETVTTIDHTAPPSIDDFLPERTCDRLEAIAADIMPVGVDHRASVEEVITHLAETYTLPSETADIRE